MDPSIQNVSEENDVDFLAEARTLQTTLPPNFDSFEDSLAVDADVGLDVASDALVGVAVGVVVDVALDVVVVVSDVAVNAFVCAEALVVGEEVVAGPAAGPEAVEAAAVVDLGPEAVVDFEMFFFAFRY